MACPFVCLLSTHVTASKTHCSTPAGVESHLHQRVRGREPSASERHVPTHHAAGRQTQGFLTHTSITPLPHQARASRVWHAKCRAMARHFACLLFSQVTTEKTHCSTQALLHQGLKGFCVSASCGDPSCRRTSGTGLPHAHLHHPSSLPGSGIQSLACKQ